MIDFKRITLSSLNEINIFFQSTTYRTCDYTIGGLYMWIDYFNYEYCIVQDTLFIKGKLEDNLNRIAFAFPIGRLPLKESITMLKEYAKTNGLPLLLSAVPEPCIKELDLYFDSQVSKLENWHDYIYEADSQVSLSGKKLSKKRNRVNKFKREHPNYVVESITTNNLKEIHDFLKKFRNLLPTKYDELQNYENEMVNVVLENYHRFPFIGIAIRVNNDIVAFTIGEIVRNTLFIHIMKGNTTYDGIYEIANVEFIQRSMESFEQIKYVNREEDVNDLGLRQAKMSYNPSEFLTKYNVMIK